MTATDLHGAALRALDGHAREFTDECAARFEAGALLANGDVHRLTTLAEKLASDLMAWNQAIQALEVSRRGAFETVRASHAIIEYVFDDVLSSAATRVLAAALDLAWSGA
jgi:hypothetical protein